MRIGIEAEMLARPEATGLENYLFHLLEGLAAVDQENEYLVYCSRPSARRLRLGANFRIWPYNRYRDDRLDVYHDPASYNLGVGPHARLVLTVHDLAWRYYPGDYTPAARSYLRRALADGIGRASAVIVSSRGVAAELLPQFPRALGRVRVIRPAPALLLSPDSCLGASGTGLSASLQGVDPGLNPSLCADARPGEYILSIASLVGRKNLVRLVRAFGRARAEGGLPEDCRLLLGGATPIDSALRSDRKNIVDAIKEGNLERNVNLCGYVSANKLAELYAGARFFVYPSLYEGFGLPVLEAMRSGSPVLTSLAGCLAETAGGAALLVDTSDEEALAEGLARLWGDGGLRAILRQRGHERVRGLTWGAVASQVLEVYNCVAGPPAR